MFLKWLWRRTMGLGFIEQLDAVGLWIKSISLHSAGLFWVICFGILYLFCYLGGIGIGPDEYYVGWWDTTCTSSYCLVSTCSILDISLFRWLHFYRINDSRQDIQ